MHLFALASTEGPVETAAIRMLADPDAGPPATIAARGCALGFCGGREHYPLSLASSAALHAVCAGDLLQALPDEPDFAERSPAELLLRRFARHGRDALGRANGLFCAVLWDEAEQRLIAVTDRVGGFQPLYYAQGGAHLALASRLHALLALPWVHRELNPAALQELLATGYVLPPTTMLAGIHKLGPGEALVFERGVVSTHVLDRAAPEPGGAAARLSPEAFEERLTGAIARGVARGGRRAYLLSGGIDSSVAATLAARVDPEPIRLFTGSFSGTRFDESAFARLIAQRLGCAHTIVDLGAEEQLDALPQIVWHLGEPSYDYSTIPTYHLLRRVREEADVVFSGDGPDHLFCRYYPLAAKRWLSPLATWLPPLPDALASRPGFSFLEKVRRAGARDLLEAYRDLYRQPTWGLNDRGRLRALLRGAAPAPPAETAYLAERRFRSRRRLAEILADVTSVDLHVDGSFGVFNKVGAMARGHRLVVREPFLDRELANCVVTLPRDQWVKGSFPSLLASRAASKYLLKHALGPRVLPAEVIAKRKWGFVPPLTNWLRERLARSPARQWLCAPLQTGELLDLAVIDRIAGEHGARARDWSVVLFLLLSVDAWYRMTLLEPERTEPRWTLRDTGFA